MITLSDIAALPHGEGKAVAISLWNEKIQALDLFVELQAKVILGCEREPVHLGGSLEGIAEMNRFRLINEKEGL